MINTKDMEQRIRDLLDKKISAGELETLHAFYSIPNLYNYSYFNRIAIWLQGGTIVSGFNGWKKLGRYVKRGEHANIAILAPSIKTYIDKDKDGKETKEKHVVGFVGVRVFDIKQTDGKPLEYQSNSQEQVNYMFEDLRSALVLGLNVKIELGITGQARGWYRKDFKEICISEFSNNTDRIKTLFHECAHHILLSEDSESSDHQAYDAGEVEAELTSNLICASLGFQVDQSAAYIAAWNKHNPQVRVLKVLGAVQKMLKIINPDRAK